MFRVWPALLAVVPLLAGACEELQVRDGWVRESLPMQRIGVAFLVLENHSESQRWLVSASSSQAGTIEIHGHQMQGGVLRMRRQQRLAVEPGSLLRLEPGGYHLMLFDLLAGLQAGQQLSLNLSFDAACELDIMLPVFSLNQEAAHLKLLETRRVETAD